MVIFQFAMLVYQRVYPNSWFDPFISISWIGWSAWIICLMRFLSNNKPSPVMVGLWHWVYHIHGAGLWQLCHAPSEWGWWHTQLLFFGVPMPASWRIVPIIRSYEWSSHSWSNLSMLQNFVVTSMSIQISRRFLGTQPSNPQKRHLFFLAIPRPTVWPSVMASADGIISSWPQLCFDNENLDFMWMTWNPCLIIWMTFWYRQNHLPAPLDPKVPNFARCRRKHGRCRIPAVAGCVLSYETWCRWR